jgi:two-component system chemotaxis response regulator CheB
MRLRHFELITARSSHPENLALFDGLLWVAHGTKESAAVWLGSRSFKESDLPRAHALLLETLGEILCCKLAGAAPLLGAAELWLKKSGHAVANTAVRAGAFEVVFCPAENRIRVSRKVRVLVVDDSKTIRNLLTKILSSDPGIEVVAVAERPSEALRLIEVHRPDVVTLDLHMPEMNGLEFLRTFLSRFPIPTVMITAVSLEDGSEVLQCLEAGAVDYIQKPSATEIAEISPQLIEKVRMAATVEVKLSAVGPVSTRGGFRKLEVSGALNRDQIFAIGSSTGGTEALRKVLTALPDRIPPTLIVQHIPAVFSKAFAERMNELCRFRVKEAEDGEEVLADHVYIAPGGRQMKIRKRGDGRKFVVIDDSAPVNRHKPSVDYLFHSLAETVGGNCVAVILTGMGADGALGLKRLRDAGARTIAQDEKSCVVFGMPREAIRLGAAEEVLSLGEIPARVVQWFSQKKAA